MNDHCDIVDIADSIEDDIYHALASYIGSKLDKEDREDAVFHTDHLYYIDLFYIYPEFRNKGIATYLIINLPMILKYCLNANIRASILCICPLMPTNNGWERLPENEGIAMSKLMKKFFIKNGYKKINKGRDDNVYAKNHYWAL